MQATDRIQFIKNWIINYCNSMEKKPDCLVVGVSGGIDSAVVSTISAMTGPLTSCVSRRAERSLTVKMPTRISISQTPIENQN